MNQDYDSLNKNKYEGNGWSKYQLLVLQQLEDHNSVLRNLNQEISNIKQIIAVNDAESKMWKTQLIDDIKKIQIDIDYVLYDETSINKRLCLVESELEAEKQFNIKWKSTWALYSSLAMFSINVIVQLISIYYKKV